MHSFLWSFSIFCWQDIAEITILSVVFLYISRWCKRDPLTPLLMQVYGYAAFYIATDIWHLPTLNMILALCAPIYGLLLVFKHQDSLQKRFIPVRTISEEQINWPETLLQTALIAASNNLSLIYVIEKNDLLDPCLTNAIDCNAPLTKGLIALITSSTLFSENNLLILTTAGKLKTIASGWKKDSLETWFSQDYADEASWIQDALICTTKTDALVFRYDVIKRTFTLISQAIIRHDISAPSLLVHLQGCNRTEPSLSLRERKPYVSQPSHQSSTSSETSSF